MAKHKPKKIKPRESPNPLLPLWLRYLRSLGILSWCVGGGALMGEHFWLGVGFIYLAFILLVLDFCYEPELKAHPMMRKFLISLVAVAFLAFTFKWVLVAAPIRVEVQGFPGEYLDEKGEDAGIKWIPEYYLVTLDLMNDQDSEKTDLDLTVETDGSIAGVGETTNHDCKVTSAVSGIKLDQVRNGKIINSYHPEGLPVPHYFIHCEKLRKRDRIAFDIATVYQDRKGLLLKKKPEFLWVFGTYQTFGGRVRHINEKLPIKEMLVR